MRHVGVITLILNKNVVIYILGPLKTSRKNAQKKGGEDFQNSAFGSPRCSTTVPLNSVLSLFLRHEKTKDWPRILHSLKTNGWIPKMMDTQNDGLEKVVPALNMAIFGIYVRFLGGTLPETNSSHLKMMVSKSGISFSRGYFQVPC